MPNATLTPEAFLHSVLPAATHVALLAEVHPVLSLANAIPNLDVSSLHVVVDKGVHT